jgi:transposase InsO family protein
LLVPMMDNTVETIVDHLFARLFHTFGYPLEIVSDGQFYRTLLQEINERLLILHLFTAPYNPAGNGVVERPHQEVWKQLRALGVGERDWDRFATAVQAILNNRHMEVLGMTPFQAMFGREMLDPFDLAMRSSFSEDLKMFISPAEWRALRAQQNKVWRERGQVICESQEEGGGQGRCARWSGGSVGRSCVVACRCSVCIWPLQQVGR